MSGALVMLLCVLSTAPKSAGTSVVPAKVHMEYGSAQYKLKEKQAIFFGKPLVRLKRDDATLICRKLIVNQDDGGGIKTAECIGDVRVERGQQTIVCTTATLDNVAGRITCRGKPAVMRDGLSEMFDNKFTYDLESGVLEASGPGKGTYVPKEGDPVLERRKKGAEGSK